MANSHGRPLLAASRRQTAIKCLEVLVFGVGGTVRCFDQCSPQPGTAFAGFAALAFAATLVVARTHAGPRSEVLGIGEVRQVRSDFGDDNLSQAAIDPRQRVPR